MARCRNALWKKIGRGEFTVDEARRAALALAAAPVELVATGPLLARAVLIAADLDHAAYDCFYLALAETLDTVCVSADRCLAGQSLDRGHGVWYRIAVR